MKKQNICIISQSLVVIVVPLLIIVGIVNFAPPSIASLILNPDKIMNIAKYKQEKQQRVAAEEASKIIKEDLKSKDGNLLNNSADPIIGNNTDPKVTIIEYVDYRCGYCKKAHMELVKLLESKKYKGKIKVIVKNYPVIGGEVSLYAAEVATSLYKKFPEKFEEFHTKIFSENLDSNQAVNKVLSSIGVKFDDIKDESIRQSIIENFKFAKKINISGTPAFIIGDQFVGGFITYEEMSKKVDDAM